MKVLREEYLKAKRRNLKSSASSFNAFSNAVKSIPHPLMNINGLSSSPLGGCPPRFSGLRETARFVKSAAYLRRDAEKPDAICPVNRFVRNQAQIRLVNERGRLQSVTALVRFADNRARVFAVRRRRAAKVLRELCRRLH